jgi:hypothetical protein
MIVDQGENDSQNIIIKNVNGEDITQALHTYMVGAIGQTKIINNLQLSNFNISPNNGWVEMFDIKNTEKVILSDIVARKDDGRIINNFIFQDTDDITLNNCNISARDSGIKIISTDVITTGNDIEIKDSNFYRDTEGQINTMPFIEIPKINNISILNTIISAPSYNTTEDNTPLVIKADTVNINNLSFISRLEGGGFAKLCDVSSYGG